MLYTILMTIFIGADHRGFELKNKLVEYLQDQNIRVEDLGNYEHDPEDDYPDYAQKVAQAVLQNPEQFLGIVICGSGIGVCMATNRNRGIYCGMGLDEEQVRHGRENDHINILSLAADNVSEEKAQEMVDAFISTQPVKKDKYTRRLKKIDSVEQSSDPHSDPPTTTQSL
ncbi:ribose-5-phosphate isomerase [Candidatus Roizmanbacteria bacterium CG_4_9_14_0_2_um_filter_39_13]|uniref:Ribose-5-phosphate isomerase n=2 Tax=Candidatus Roizmaniibacteriota TaxID=1752723 RepID=A0A2M8F0F8_9BACT|nr:MAG: ribose-5-phosphate isomerase [Candidatus Roizmanbacteria bacterium CG_4_10_14_0_2_um_filter_39_12]PJC32774.1 MAG: ribose-5-phosphate isomerase [Candidatus Roizmanbacteria bacterium CG_4_9_14_0_2_um_filter_39_13]PJE61306.1 MAG: ribose-5-phosphate isomerase [Candidatus Roizmanbacteria bacterium CG10_big_fil_rev_8_21_14_0_10_39_12]